MRNYIFPFILALFSFLTLLLFAGLIFTGCGPSREEMEAKARGDAGIKDLGNGYEVVTIDGCEYIKGNYYSAGANTLTHKGNCKNWKNHHDNETLSNAN